ncbi:hypothetical protein MNEG_14617 [Monoraphidium neglectum]|uniref:Uncharacterized protein n=1 Tax=Monoraphidium neglectum TaxID=145388 RepID=A0A0D2LUR0_9CHLO|nr:hypothetical protein MNEG_14617 [Monoraphidium neglectum]KIY93346.1 hypothetical protein MNEG_14617 [Monoraphidium neglectum]|eukprot:XP_013892366.1 hypothetical protein MNEG_14617 [Monoraphidium neglectum]
MATAAREPALKGGEQQKRGSNEVPSGMEAEARLLEQLTSIPLISKATLRPARVGKGVQITTDVAT